MPTSVEFPLVEIQRKIGTWPQWGFIVAEGRSHVVVQQIDASYNLDGYCGFRREDISLIEKKFKKKPLITAALRIKNQTPVKPAGLRLGSMRSLMESAQNVFGVLVIHREKAQPDDVEVGTVRITTDDTYVLRWLNTLAEWENDDRPFRYRDITLLEFGTDYDQTLLAVAKDRENAVGRRARSEP